MTEAEWLAAAQPTPMLEHVRQTIRVGRAEGRKNYLLAVACCRLAWELLEDERLRRGVLWAEAFADDTEDPAEWPDIVSGVYHAYQAAHNSTGHALDHRFKDERASALAVSRLIQKVPSYATADVLVASTDSAGLNPTGAALIREVFGNPFRSVTLSPSWRTDTAVSLARQMYGARDFSAMPILADALQDAGCDSDDVLNHCRGPGPHVRGCWVCDLVLGKV
jgi:hypothetical protein